MKVHMVKKEENKEEKESNEKKLIQEALEVPEIAEEVKKQAEEKGKKYFLEEKIKSIDINYLNDTLPIYRDLEKNEFNEIISQREKIVHDPSKFSLSELEQFTSKIDVAKRVESGFQQQKEVDDRRARESTPTMTVTTSGLPKDISEIEKDPEKYERFRVRNSKNYYWTDDPHKEFETYEKHDLCSIHNDDCREASTIWSSEHIKSKLKNKRFQKSFEIITN